MTQDWPRSRHLAGQLTDSDYEELAAVIEIARSGDWKTAEQECYEFRQRRPFVREGR